MRWTIDPTHSSIEFSVRHLGLATVKGRFRTFEAFAEVSDEGRLHKIEAVIDALSVDTGTKERDDHLRSPDFFDAAKYPEIRFVSTALKALGGNRTEVTGNLTLHGVTYPVGFTLEQSAPVKDPWGNTRVAVSAGGSLNRKDWGLSWNQALELGGVVVSEEVKFSIEAEVLVAEVVAA